MVDWALYYARRGVAVFPCDPATKKPLTPCDIDANGKKIRGTGGVKKATTDETTIREMWRVHPNAMIGAATGAPSGFWVVDPDAPHENKKTGMMTTDGRVVWAELQAKHGAHDPTIEVMTPGGGQHTYFKFDPAWPLGNAEGDLAGLGGINIRGSGGYVIVAPSVLADGKAYVAKRLFDPAALADVPEWLYGLIRGHKRRDRAAWQPTGAVGARERAYAAKALKGNTAELAETDDGARNNKLNAIAYRMGRMIGAGWIERDAVERDLREACDTNGLSCSPNDWFIGGRDEVEDTMASGIEAGIKDPVDPLPIAAVSSYDAETFVDKMALEFAEKFNGNYQHVKMWNIWLVWTGSYWKEDRTYTVFRAVRDFVRSVEMKINADKKEKGDNGKSAKLVDIKTVNTIETYTKTDHRFAAEPDRWDQDKWILNTPDGVVDLHTGKMQPARPEDYCRRITSIGPAPPGTPCPMFDKILETSFKGNKELIRFVWRALGYSLTGSIEEHAMFFNHGDGANGKGVVMNTVALILDKYCGKASIETFLASHNAQHLTFIADLDGPRLVLVSETEQGRYWDEAKLCDITGGDPIKANRMRCDPYQFRPVCKLWVCGNHKPRLKNVGEAIKRRMNRIPFDVIIPPSARDTKLIDKLEPERPAILRKMVDGCLEWQRIGLAQPQAIIEATKEYLDGEDIIARWKDECVINDPNAWTQSSVLYASIKHWAETNGERIIDQRTFTQRLKSWPGLEWQKTAKGNGFSGIKLASYGLD